jgi:pyruvate/2-oxoglutarate dehydrogenase complex dihydrolipoamide acyltransferase (E2) component
MSVSITEAVVNPPRAGISWPAVFAGAVVASAVTAMLVALGSGLGLATISPVSGSNPSATTFTVVAAIWLILVQWISSFFAGYLAGRLRPALGGVHGDEVMFRDTASGFVSWAVASLLIVGLVSSGASSLLGSAGRAAASLASSAAGGAASSASASPADPSGYLLDTLFRPTQAPAEENTAESKAEAGRILATAATGDLSQEDHDYLAKIVAARTGLAPADAGKRVDDVVAKERQSVEKAKQAAEAARKAAASFAFYTFFSMLIGAFIACVAGAIGGRQRDAF